jgi:hypothetical protein
MFNRQHARLHDDRLNLCGDAKYFPAFFSQLQRFFGWQMKLRKLVGEVLQAAVIDDELARQIEQLIERTHRKPHSICSGCMQVCRRIGCPGGCDCRARLRLR